MISPKAAHAVRSLAHAGLLPFLLPPDPPPVAGPPPPGECLCGRHISENKRLCLACSQDGGKSALGARLAAHIQSGSDLQRILSDAGKHAPIVLEAILPHLKYTHDVELARLADDGCPHV